jgi:hypothetical protein
MGGSTVWIWIPIVAILSGVATTWIRAKHGYPPYSGRYRRKHAAAEAQAEIDKLRSTAESQDAALAKLEERVRVLERIVTDSRSRLGEEIERLRA